MQSNISASRLSPIPPPFVRFVLRLFCSFYSCFSSAHPLLSHHLLLCLFSFLMSFSSCPISSFRRRSPPDSPLIFWGLSLIYSLASRHLCLSVFYPFISLSLSLPSSDFSIFVSFLLFTCCLRPCPQFCLMIHLQEAESKMFSLVLKYIEPKFKRWKILNTNNERSEKGSVRRTKQNQAKFNCQTSNIFGSISLRSTWKNMNLIGSKPYFTLKVNQIL